MRQPEHVSQNIAKLSIEIYVLRTADTPVRQTRSRHVWRRAFLHKCTIRASSQWLHAKSYQMRNISVKQKFEAASTNKREKAPVGENRDAQAFMYA